MHLSEWENDSGIYAVFPGADSDEEQEVQLDWYVEEDESEVSIENPSLRYDTVTKVEQKVTMATLNDSAY